MKYLLNALIFFSIVNVIHSQNNYTQYVNPFVGTDGNGHTFPGATTPFAMVQLSPDTRIDGSWEGCSGYHYSDSFIHGFSHTHLSGTGCSDYGDIAFIPSFVNKPVEPIEKVADLSQSFSHKNEKATAGYYSVLMDNGVKVELTATSRVGLQKYTYSKSGYAWITLNLKHRDELLEGKITEIDKQTFSGYRRSKAWAEDQLVYYYFKINKVANGIKILKDSSGEYRLHLGYWVEKGESILIKTALSSVDEDGAKKNLLKELNHWDFNKVKSSASLAWNTELSRIQAFGASDTIKRNFYTALYHCMMHPNILNDVDGRYRGRDKKVHVADSFNYYTVFSLWDTYRALHPLLNLIDKKRSHDFMMTFKAQYEQSGRLPMWELWGNETDCMIGFHSVSVILNAYLNKVITKDELQSLWPAVEAEYNSNRFGLGGFKKYGFLSSEDESSSVSKTIEYSFNMHCVRNIYLRAFNKDLILMNKLKNYEFAWVNLYNQHSGFLTPRYNGNWVSDFNPYQVDNNYTEANAWQYKFAVQHHAQYISSDLKLSQLFNASSHFTGQKQVDITGLIGQYAHGNEPSHHVAYLFKNRDSTVKYVNRIRNELYNPKPDGLCGNDDCGQMSAWYVFSAMGFYPANPASVSYSVGSMLFDSVKIQTGENQFVMLVNNENKNLDAKKYTSYRNNFYFNNKSRQELPYYLYEPIFGEGSGSQELNIGFAPLIKANAQVFKDSLLLVFEHPQIVFENEARLNHRSDFKYTKDTTLVYNLWEGGRQNGKISIFENSNFLAQSRGSISKASFYKRPNSFDIQLKSVYNKQYTAGGPNGLLDGLKGDLDWRKGRWQGYQSQDFEAVIDLKNTQAIESVNVDFLSDERSWIFLPISVEIYGSNDSIQFEKLGQVDVNGLSNYDSVWRVNVNCVNRVTGSTYQYIKVMAKNYGKLPDWHPGKGEDAFIFIDEIEIKVKND